MSAGLAARVAGWQYRLGGQAGPLGPVSAGSGESPSGAAVQVEAFIDGLWTDITSRVMTRDGSYNISTTRGQANEGSQTDPATCHFQLNNRDGLFSPRNPTSPYYGKIGRNTQLRVSVQSGLDKSYRFWGEVAAWPPKWDTTGADVWVELEAAGIMRRLGQGQAPLGSTMRIALSGPTVEGWNSGQLNPVVAYWPCEDAAGATSIASGLSGAPPMTITGSPTLSSFTGFVCSSPLPVMGTTGIFTGQVPAYTTSVATMVRFLLAVPAGGATSGVTMCTISATGTVKSWEVYYDSAGAGTMGLRGKDGLGVVLIDTTSAGGFSVNGKLAQISAEFVQNGTGIDCIISTMILGSGTAGGPTATLASSTMGVVTTIGMGGAISDTTIGHVRVQTASAAPLDNFDLLDQIAAFAGETAGRRMERLCAIAGVSFESVGSLDSTVTMGPQLSATLLDLVREAALADGGILYEQIGALGLGYRTRISLENQAATLALSYPGFNLAQIPAPVDDDQHTRNDITINRTGGSSARATLDSGPLSTLAPPAGVGLYDEAITLNIESDGDLPDQAQWRLHLGTVDEARQPTVSVNLAHSSFTASTTLVGQALALRPGDRLTISDPPAWLPPDDISQLVLGYSETIDQFQHRITWNCAPESPYRIAVLDDTTLGRLDTAGSVLAIAAGPTDTALTVTTTTPPAWVTTATDPDEFPLDVRAGGEVIRVVAVGTVADTFTRSVSSGWGAADAGGAWTTSGGSASEYTVDGSMGNHSCTTVSTTRRSNLPGTYGNVDIYTTISTDKLAVGAMQTGGIMARIVDANNLYHARISPQTSGAITLNIISRVASVETTLASVTTTLTHVAGTRYRLRFQLSGTALSAKAWLAGTPEPSAWGVTTTDANFSSGLIGTRSLVSAGTSNLPVSINYDDFAIVDSGDQTFTVIRSINGCVKTLPVGTDVRLDQPAILAL